MFIVFEGGEGAGKGTQISRLVGKLEARGLKTLCTREPGGTPEAERIRNLLVQREGGNWTPMTEVFLFFAARVQHTETKIKPALEQGITVLCDRYSDSTRAYQAYGHAMDLSIIDRANDLALGDFKPDLTIILDIDPEQGLRRSIARLGAQTSMHLQTEDRFEKMKMDFHTRLRRGYLAIAAREPNRCVVIDASGDVDNVAEAVWKIVEQRINVRG